jgi:hypothetical protein
VVRQVGERGEDRLPAEWAAGDPFLVEPPVCPAYRAGQRPAQVRVRPAAAARHPQGQVRPPVGG